MLDYRASVDVTSKPHQTSLGKAPTPGLRDWRDEMARPDVESFERVAGDLLAELGYELTTRAPGASRPPSETRCWGRYRTQGGGLERPSSRAVYRSPLWRRRHPYVI